MKAKIHPAVMAVGLPALIGLILILAITSSSEQKRAEDLVQAYAESIARGVSAFFIDASAVASAAASLTSVKEFSLREASADLIGLIRANSYIRRISIVDAEGYIYDTYATGAIGNRWQGGRRTENNSDPNAELANASDSSFFRLLVKENEDGKPYVITNDVFVPYHLDGKSFVTSAPIIKEGKPIGVVNVVQTALELSRLYEDITMDFLEKFGEEAYLFLVSRDGELVSSLKFNATYGAYLDELFGAAETTSVATLGDDMVFAIDEAVRNERLVVTAEIDGSPHFIAGVKLEHTPFAVCLAASKGQMLFASRLIFLVATSAFAITALLVAIVFIVMSRRMTEPAHRPPKPRRQKQPSRARWAKDFDDDLVPPELPPDNG